MLGKIIGGVLGAKAAKRSRGGVDESGGALIGVASVALARRFGIPGMVAAAVGGYAIKRYNEKKRIKSTRYPTGR
jgi:hypothetical protein